MATAARDLSVAKNSDAADTIAAAIHDLAENMVVSTASDASKRRMLRKHAREVVSLHDDLSAEEIFRPRVAAVPENGRPPHGMPQIPTHQEG